MSSVGLLLLWVGCQAGLEGAAEEAGGEAAAQATTVSLAGVHWYSGDQQMLDASAPAGQRGWNVETVIGVDDGAAVDHSLDMARRARDHGLVNLIRIDYRPQLVVPLSDGELEGWAQSFYRVARRFQGEGLATRFIVGNEANIESCGQPAGCTSAAQYARAYNYLHGHGGRPGGIELLVAGPATFSPNVKIENGRGVFDFGGTFLDWLSTLSGALQAADGFALHSYGDPEECGDPASACTEAGGRFSRNFISFREQIDRLSRWGARPVYLTEINTFTGGKHPQANYRAGWIGRAFQILREYNAGRGGRPPVLAAAWFVDRDDGGWGDFALRNVAAARGDLTAEFHNAQNRGGGGGGGGCQGGAALGTPSDRWKLEIFNSRGLTGAAVAQRYDAPGDGGFRFDWGTGRPGAGGCTGDDNYGVRFSRRAYFPRDAEYTFTATTDDGVRLWVDGSLIIDRWVDQAPSASVARRGLSTGWHDLRMDYYENGGGAYAELGWSASGGGGDNCACRSDVDNFCHYAPRTGGCAMTAPGGYCDPNGDGGYEDADWVRGYNEFHARCR